VVADGGLRLAERFLEVAGAALPGAAMRLSSRSRTGSARAEKAPASCSASAGASGAASVGVQQASGSVRVASGLRQLRHRRAAAQARADRGRGRPGSLNHLGVEVETSDEVRAATSRLAGEGLDTAREDQVSCCYAEQDKVWVDGPDGEAWEVYTVLADAEHPAGRLRPSDPGDDARCCSAAPESASRCC